MEALEVPDEQWAETRIDFRQFVKNVELNCQKTEVSRRNKVLLRKKNKENWLVKSKIIPPSFSKLGEDRSSASQEYNPMLNLASFNDYRRTTPVIESQAEFRTLSREPTFCENNDIKTRKECKTSHTILRGYGSNERPKQNWKLQYRRDELNVLRYVRQEETEERTPSPKSFKLRKVQKKFQELKPSIHQLYRSNIDNVREVITPSPKVRYRIFNSRQ